jgi:hypothetical protein
MKFQIFNPYPEQEYFRDKKPEAWEAKVFTVHINRDFKRNDLLKITNGNKVIFRYSKGVSYPRLVQNQIWIDYDSRLELGVDFGSEVKVVKANIVEEILVAPLKSPVPWERHNQIWNLLFAILLFILGINIK